MSPEERELLTRSIELSEENNKMLRSMRRSARFSSFLRLVYWVLIIGSAIWTYYFIQPYLEAIIKGYEGMQKGVQSVSSVTDKIPKLPSLPSWLGGNK